MSQLSAYTGSRVSTYLYTQVQMSLQVNVSNHILNHFRRWIHLAPSIRLKVPEEGAFGVSHTRVLS